MRFDSRHSIRVATECQSVFVSENYVQQQEEPAEEVVFVKVEWGSRHSNPDISTSRSRKCNSCIGNAPGELEHWRHRYSTTAHQYFAKSYQIKSWGGSACFIIHLSSPKSPVWLTSLFPPWPITIKKLVGQRWCCKNLGPLLKVNYFPKLFMLSLLWFELFQSQNTYCIGQADRP
jgi:hypothetical protein